MRVKRVFWKSQGWGFISLCDIYIAAVSHQGLRVVWWLNNNVVMIMARLVRKSEVRLGSVCHMHACT